MAERRHTIQGSLFCALVFAACFCASWPIAEMGFDDDWSYIKSAQVFAQTGHIIYNGWAAMILGWQLLWGALFIRLFGFSFTAVKLSTLPIAIATIVLFHAIQIRFGISARNAVIGTLTLALSPLFLPLAASYMSDIPGLFVILLCLYFCKRAIAAGTDTAAIRWLWLAAVSNVAGGTVRQIAWLGTLVMVPSTGWLLRKRCGVLRASIALWCGSVASIFYFMHWYASQPYSVPAILLPSPLVIPIAAGMVGEILCLVLISFPIFVAWLGQARKITLTEFSLIAVMLTIFAGIEWSGTWILPWNPNILEQEFSSAKTFAAWDLHAFLLPMLARRVISVLVLAASLAAFAVVRRKRWESGSDSAGTARQEMFWLFAPFILGYFALLVPSASQSDAFDRYMLCVMPFVIIWLTRLHQEWVAPKLPSSSVATLAVFAVLAVAGTHDWFALQRAQLAAIGEVLASGVPRTAIQGGIEYDGWTQLEIAGHVNNPVVKVPAEAYQADTRYPPVPDGCKPWFAPRLPSIQPKYTVMYVPEGCFLQAQYPGVRFRAWLPPFQRAVYVQQIPGHEEGLLKDLEAR